MKAIILKNFGDSDNFVLEEVPTPVNAENNVLVKIKATAFNPIDYQMRRGATESKLLKSPILGRELSGIVVETAANASFAIGDEVVAYVGSLGSNGTYCEYISVPPELLAIKPTNISFAEAAAMPLASLTAWQCFERLKPSNQNSIFITGGAGGVGTMIIKILLAHGINNFITTAGNAESKAHLLRLGVKHENILDYKSPDLTQKILKINANQPFDYCIDLVGSKLSEVCSEILKINGVYADVTNLATKQTKELLFDKGILVVNISNYAYGLSGDRNDLFYYGQKLEYLMNLVSDNKLTPPPIQVIGNMDVSTVKKAHFLLETNKANNSKLVMRID